jgi:hypothetical protein
LECHLFNPETMALIRKESYEVKKFEGLART